MSNPVAPRPRWTSEWLFKRCWSAFGLSETSTTSWSTSFLRMNRNRVDDAMVLMELRRYGVGLISATEPIDETPEGQLMHALLAAMNEFRSKGDGADIRYKMSEKARKKAAPSGLGPPRLSKWKGSLRGPRYTVVVPDPERAPLILTAFELFARGEFTMDQLVEELTASWPQDRASPRRPAKPISKTRTRHHAKGPLLPRNSHLQRRRVSGQARTFGVA